MQKQAAQLLPVVHPIKVGLHVVLGETRALIYPYECIAGSTYLSKVKIQENSQLREGTCRYFQGWAKIAVKRADSLASNLLFIM